MLPASEFSRVKRLNWQFCSSKFVFNSGLECLEWLFGFDTSPYLHSSFGRILLAVKIPVKPHLVGPNSLEHAFLVANYLAVSIVSTVGVQQDPALTYE